MLAAVDRAVARSARCPPDGERNDVPPVRRGRPPPRRRCRRLCGRRQAPNRSNSGWLSRLSVQLVRSSAAAGSKPASESVSEVRSGWMIGSSRSSKSAFAGAAVTAEPVAIAAAARNAPTAPPMMTTRRRRTLALRDWCSPWCRRDQSFGCLPGAWVELRNLANLNDPVFLSGFVKLNVTSPVVNSKRPTSPACPTRYGSGPPAAIADSVANCSPSSDAPPTRAPSTSSCATMSPMFLAFTEPP